MSDDFTLNDVLVSYLSPELAAFVGEDTPIEVGTYLIRLQHLRNEQMEIRKNSKGKDSVTSDS
jgi:hypothetical protein